MLNENEIKKYKTIEQVVNGTMTRKEASLELNISLRQIDRLKRIYADFGKDGFINKNRGKTNINKKDRLIIEELEKLYLNEYYDFNFEHFYEIICKDYDISYCVMVSEFKKDDIISPLAHKKTIKLYNEKMQNAIEKKENIAEVKIELYQTRLISIEKARIRKSSNLYAFGEEVQIDACYKLWFGNIVCALHLAVDRATKKVLFGWFEYEEITRGYMILLYNIIINYGIPKKIKADNRNSFSNQTNKVDTTQFGIICAYLGIELSTSSDPTFKPNVERENGTFKNRLIAELRHEGITEIDEANAYLNNIFIPNMNKKYSYEIDKKTSKMRSNNYSVDELNLIISEKYERIIDNASSIKYNTKYYIPVDKATGEIVTYKSKTKCTFIISYNGDYWCQIENKYYQLIELKDRDTTMKKESNNNKPIEKTKYIPPANHPWRKMRIN